ncbi:Porphobilinogen deaminase [Ceratocystis fimbriata CBS 114723]|uniref:Porphobilinogen deaminase n=1 Tax=Ceratocystis fimbriata CBS 114723 TaxID=1035309 RepID=A0A2C5X2D9_9PEZI|nr:Porphobilinogen deaminase [Ceratocystis fimbriata CBS 114723]
MSAPSQPTIINIGSRKSALALKQTDLVIQALQKLHPDHEFRVNSISTAGDKDQVTALYNFGGKGLWTNELEAMLAANEVDFIVHSLKDMPTAIPAGFTLACITEREDPRDVVVFKASLGTQYTSLADLPAGSVVGTSSIRRIAQLKRRYQGLEFADVRGNIQTRLRKLDDDSGPFSAIILAAAGLLRMDYGERIAQYLDSESAGVLHAVGQGAIGVEAREGDERIAQLLVGIQHEKTRLACTAERSVMRALEGGCSVPIGVETSWVGGGDVLRLKATVVRPNGSEAVDADEKREIKTVEDAHVFGNDIAKKLSGMGADKILEGINALKHTAPVKQVETPATTA